MGAYALTRSFSMESKFWVKTGVAKKTKAKVLGIDQKDSSSLIILHPLQGDKL